MTGSDPVLDPFDVTLDARFWLVFVTAIVAGFLRGFVGFGAALVNVPVLSLVYGPLMAIPVANLISLPGAVQLLPDALRHGERAIVVPTAVAMLLAAPLGTWVLVSVDPRIMKMVIAVLVIALVALLARGWRLAGEPGLAVLLGAGAAGGLVQGVAGVGGPPVVAVALSRPGTASQQRGNVLGVMTTVSLAALLPMWLHDMFTREVLVLSLLLLAPTIVSTWVGSRYFAGRGQGQFRRAALVVLALVAVVTFGSALRDFMAA